MAASGGRGDWPRLAPAVANRTMGFCGTSRWDCGRCWLCPPDCLCEHRERADGVVVEVEERVLWLWRRGCGCSCPIWLWLSKVVKCVVCQTAGLTEEKLRLSI